MTDCDDDRERRIQPELDGDDLHTPDGDGAAILVRRPTDPRAVKLSTRVELNEHDAVVHGVASYIATLETAVAGRHVALSRVVTSWADHDDGQVPAPSAVVFSTEVGRYDSIRAAPQRIAPDRHGKITTLSCTAIYALDELTVTVMCEDKLQRSGVRKMLVDAFSPVEWMSGFRLILPRYHSAVTEYLLVSGQQPDATQTAAASLWPLTLRLHAWCPVYRDHSLPLARPIARGTIVAG